MKYFFEYLAVKQADSAIYPLPFDDLTGDFEVSLINLSQTFVDDILVELLLLFKLKHLGRFSGEHSGKAVEHRIMEIRIKGGDDFQWTLQGFGHLDSGL